MIHHAVVKALWLELRIAGQYPKQWRRIEDSPIDPRTGKLRKAYKSPHASPGSTLSLPPPGSPLWLEMIEPPPKFYREELGFGIGEGPNIVSTAATNRTSNKRRREDAEKHLAELARAFVIRRTVTA